MIKQNPEVTVLTAPEIQAGKPDTAQEKQDSAETVMTGDLREAIMRYREQGEKNIRIVLDATDVDELADIVKDFGGMVLRKGAGFLAIEIPVDSVEQLIRENSSIGYARLPFRFFPTGMISEGVAITGANRFHDTIYRGAGIKIAVIDVGFMGLTQAISNGELPAGVIKRDFSALGLETEYYHGTACAEIVHDMAPDAELHLLKLGDEIDGYEVIDYCINNKIDIVSMSISTFGSGPGDGTGPVDETFDRLREAGILLAASAGNCGTVSYTYEDGITLTLGSHWEGTFNDNDGDKYHEFKEWDVNSEYNVIWAYPDEKDDGESLTDEISILIRWDDWPYSDIDYDMELYTFDYENQRIGTKLNIQQTLHDGNQPPIEYISLNVPDTATDGVFYALKVKRKTTASPTGTRLEIYLGGTSSFIPYMQADGTVNSLAVATSESSMMEPADAESVMAVGAIDYMSWENGPQEEFSSQGPTNNWNGSAARIKPDVMGPDGVTTYAYNVNKNTYFFGTSAAAPHAAGLAALILSMNPELTPDELQDIIEENAIHFWSSQKDNQYGWGKINVTLPGFPIVKSHQKISGMDGNFTGTLDYYSNFGNSVASIGDLDGDGIEDIAVGAYGANSNMGAVWVLFMNSDGTVKTHQKISSTEGNFTGTLDSGDYFGSAVASIGDLNGDGITDLAVGAYQDDDGNYDQGAVWILFMKTDGTVKSHQKISGTEGNFMGTLGNYINFGCSVASLGDLNGDGIEDLAIGASRDNDGKGSVWILFMNSDGKVKAHQKISSTEGNFKGALDYNYYFGCSVASVADLNGDGIEDLAIGAKGNNNFTGAVWILFMNSNGTVKSHQKISGEDANFAGTIDYNDNFGSSIASIGDFDGDGIRDLAIGAPGDDDSYYEQGAVWILFMNSNGTVKYHQKINGKEGYFTGTLDYGDSFGSSVASIGDLNGDGIRELAVGAYQDDDGNSNQGAAWILYLDPLAIKIDMDHDGIPDVWERRYGLNPEINDSAEDSDGDRLTNILEYSLGTNPKNRDTDNDGISDGDEDKNRNGVVDLGETDPLNPDTDNDGMPDGWEVQYKLNPLVNDAGIDSDYDGYSNLQEYQSGTDPKNNTNHPNPPVAQAGNDQTVDEGTEVTLNGSGSTDPDDGIVAYQWTQLDVSSVTLSDAASIYPVFTAPDVRLDNDDLILIFQLTVTDKGGLQSSDQCIVKVKWVYVPPVARNQTLETDEDHPLEITLHADHDPDLEAITYTVVDQVTHGVLTGNAPDLLYTPNSDYFGSDSFTFRANDGYSDSGSAEITINVISTVGDLDDNGVINMMDAILAIQACTGIDSDAEIYIKEEVNGDGRIGMEDVLYILRKISERIE